MQAVTVDTAELRRLLAAATPGPWAWRWNPNGSLHRGEFRAPDPHNGFMLVAALTNEADGDIMVAAVNALPVLLDRLETYRDALEVAEVAVNEMYHSYQALIGRADVTREQAMTWDGPICARRVLDARSALDAEQP